MKGNLEDGFECAIVHLASICDLVEEFLEKLLLFLAACKKQPVELFAKMTCESYLELARAWYKDNYRNIYEHYLSKGKKFKFVLPSRKNLLDSFLEKDPKWRKIKSAFQDIRTYRNKVVHAPFLLNIERSGKLYLPTPKAISKLYTYDQIRGAWRDQNRRKNEFDEKQKLGLDLQRSLFSAINYLWSSLVEEVKTLGSQRNRIYLSGIGF